MLSLLTAGMGLVLHQTLARRQAETKQEHRPKPADKGPDRHNARPDKRAHTDRYGDPLPKGAVARLGTVRLQHEHSVYALAFSPDGKALAAGSHDHTVRLWQTRTGKELRKFKGHTQYINSVAFSPDGRVLASGGFDQTIRLWEVATGKELRKIEARDEVTSVAFSPHGKTLASGSPNVLYLWDAATGSELRKIQGHAGAVYFVAFSADGKTLVSGGSQTIRLWQTATGKELRRLKGHENPLACRIALAPDGKSLASAGFDGIRLWAVDTGKLLKELATGQVFSVAFSPDGKRLACGGANGTVRLLEVGTGKEVFKVEAAPGMSCAVAFCPDGKTLASTGGMASICLWEVPTGRRLLPGQGHRESVWSVVFSADGKAVASASIDGTVRLWNAATGKQLLRLDGHDHWVTHVVFSPDGRKLASGDMDGTVLLWDTATGKQLLQRPLRFTPRDHGENRVESLVFSPDGATLAARGQSERLHLWAVSSGKEVAEYHAGGGPAIAFLDSQKLATAGSEGVHLWRAGKGKGDFVLRGEPKTFSPGCYWAFSPGCQTAACASLDGPVRLWDLETGKELGKLQGAGQGSLAFVRDTIAFSPDGRTLLAREDGGPYRVWEVATRQEVCRFRESESLHAAVFFTPEGKPVALEHGPVASRLRDPIVDKALLELRGHVNGVQAFALSPDGRSLVTGDWAGTMLVWDVFCAGRPGALGRQELAKFWVRLADKDASKAYEAIWALTAARSETMAFLKPRLRPAKDAGQMQRIAKLIADLDDGNFAVRERASRALRHLGAEAEPQLRRALQGKRSLEVRRRAEILLAALEHQDSPLLDGELLRTVRAIQVLEGIGSMEARQVLEALSKGVSAARETREAKVSLERLARRTAARP
jgi:WD40 repeat protein